MRVRPSRRPAPYLNGADQRRMLAMVLALALVLSAATWASNPANWYWIAPPQATATSAGAAEEAPPDFSIREDAPLPPGTIRVAAATQTPTDGDDEGNDDPADGRLPADLTAAAQDRRVGLNRAELDSVAAILDRFEQTPPSVAADDAPVAFPALMRDPAYYRGRTVRIAGLARGITDLPGDRGVELWVFLPDAGDNPVRVRANQAEDLPRGALLETPVPVTLDGAFFKLQGYAARGKNDEGRLHVAPLIVADEAERAVIAPAVPQTPASLPWVVLGVIAAALAGGALLVWRWKASDRDFERSTLARLSAAADAQGEPLNFAADDADAGAFLAGLSEVPSAAPAGAPSAAPATATQVPATEPTVDPR